MTKNIVFCRLKVRSYWQKISMKAKEIHCSSLPHFLQWLSVTSLSVFTLISGCWHKWSLIYQQQSKSKAGTFREAQKHIYGAYVHNKPSTVRSLCLADFGESNYTSCTADGRLRQLNDRTHFFDIYSTFRFVWRFNQRLCLVCANINCCIWHLPLKS